MVPLLITRSNALDEPAAGSHHLTNFDAASAQQAACAGRASGLGDQALPAVSPLMIEMSLRFRD